MTNYKTGRKELAKSYIATPIILAGLTAAALILTAGEAGAASTVLSDAPSCTAIGGTWDSGTSTCTISGTLTLTPSDSLQIAPGVVLANHGTITSSGAITNHGTIFNTLTGVFTSSGHVNNDGIVNNCGLITFSGFALVNSGTINNCSPGIVTDTIGITNTGTVTNQGKVTETGTVTNSGGKFVNFKGTFTNTGTFNTGSFFDCAGTVTGVASGIVSTDCTGLTAPAINCSLFVLPESPIGTIALATSSLAALGGFLFLRKKYLTKNNSSNTVVAPSKPAES